MSLQITTETDFLLDMVNLAFGPELHTSANAASDPNSNEADATTGWTPTNLTGTGANVFESQGAVKNTGSYALHSDANDTPTSGAMFHKDFTVDAGGTYNISYYRRHIGSGGTWRMQANNGDGLDLIDTILVGEITFTELNTNITMVSGTTLQVAFQEGSGSDDGGIYVDNLSLRKVL